jgi:zinc finger protein
MSNPTQEDPRPDGAAFDDFFESLGKKAENLSINDQNGKHESALATNGTVAAKPGEKEDQRVVDEIESLCMNCRENVGHLFRPSSRIYG